MGFSNRLADIIFNTSNNSLLRNEPSVVTEMLYRVSFPSLLLSDNSLLRFVAVGNPQFPRIHCCGSVRSDCSSCRGDGYKITRHNNLKNLH